MTRVRRRTLSPRHRAFALEYLANGFNASAAYRSAYPKASDATARVEGPRHLLKPAIKAFITPRLEAHWQARQMAGDEALARVAMDASADPRRLLDEVGKPLNPKHWPDEIANSVETVEFRDGVVSKVRLVNKLGARRTILEQTGKLKNPVGDIAKNLGELLARMDAEHEVKGGDG